MVVARMGDLLRKGECERTKEEKAAERGLRVGEVEGGEWVRRSGE